MEWIKKLVKKVQNSFVIWKSILNAFPLIEKWLIWKIRNGSKFLLGKDPWIGCNENHVLSDNLVHALNGGGFFYLSQVTRKDYVTRHVRWMS